MTFIYSVLVYQWIIVRILFDLGEYPPKHPMILITSNGTSTFFVHILSCLFLYQTLA